MIEPPAFSTIATAEAEARAARLWGADVCRFSTGGATHANQALALAVGGEGKTVVVSRTLHRSLLLGLVLAGLTPVWVRPETDAITGLPLGVAPESVAAALAAHPEASAVFVGDPSYVGTIGDVQGLAQAAHAHDVPLIVDAAWAAHFGFHPDLPPHPLQCGADAMVTSAHKTLPFWLQAVFFGALLSVIMSTASSTLLAPSVTFTENVLKNFRPGMTDDQLLRATRLTVFGFTLLVVANATLSNASIHAMVENAYRITLAGVFVPLTAGLFWRRASNLGAALSISLGLGSWLILEVFFAELPFEPQLIGLALSLLGMVVGSYARPNPHVEHPHGISEIVRAEAAR